MEYDFIFDYRSSIEYLFANDFSSSRQSGHQRCLDVPDLVLLAGRHADGRRRAHVEDALLTEWSGLIDLRIARPV